MGGLLFMAKANLPPNTYIRENTNMDKLLFMAKAIRRRVCCSWRQNTQ